MATLTPRTRPRRSSSVIQYLSQAGIDPEHHINHLGAAEEDSHLLPDPDPIQPSAPFAPTTRRTKPLKPSSFGPDSLQWVQNPWQSFQLIVTCLIGSICYKVAFPASTRGDNPFTWFYLIQYPLIPRDAGREDVLPRYRKGPRDVLYVIGWVVVFSCARQSLRTPLFGIGRFLGLKRTRKLERFMEQGYAFIYFTTSSLYGLYVMSQQDSWFYNTEHFWLKYPHWDMPGIVKTYYLTQLAYWCQQALVMIAGLEKPRDDYVELVLHHCITLWLVLASYLVNLTQIGIAVFVSMDIPDATLAISKCINYIGLEMTSNISFVIFLGTWFYFRHFQEFRILHSVYTQFELIPKEARVWDPMRGYWMPNWMQWQIFLPIAALQLLMIFWAYLILRVLFRMISGKTASDVREEGETETELDEEDSKANSTGFKSRSGSEGAAKRNVAAR